jgi:hypothetical protein
MSNFQNLFGLEDGSFDTFTLTSGAAEGYLLECVDSLGTGKWSSLTDVAVASIEGTANQVIVNGTVGIEQKGAILLSLPQDISTTSSPVFSEITGELLTGVQPGITSLPSLLSIQGYLINAGSWPYLSSLNQNLSTFSDVSFNNLSCGQLNSTNISAAGAISINQAYVPGGVNYMNFRNGGIGRWIQGMINAEVGGSSGSDFNIWSLSDSNTLSSALTITRSNQAVTIPGPLNATLATASQPNITSLGGVSGVTLGGALTGPSCNFSGNVSGLTGGFTNSVTTKNVNATVAITGGALSATTASLTGALTMNTNNISGVATLSANALIGGILSATSGSFTGNVNMNFNNISSANNVSCITLSGVNIAGTNCNVTTVNAGSPAASDGAINSNSAGVYSYNTATRYIRFNTNGSANDLMSAGAPMVINFSDNGNPTPQNVEFFGLSNAATSSSVFINGNLLLGNQGTYATNSSPTRCLTIKAGPSQSTSNLLAITNASNSVLLACNTTATTVSQPLRLNTLNDNTNGNVTSGSFTPTVAVSANLTSVTANTCTYSRIGNVVSFAGSINIRPNFNYGGYTRLVSTINYPIAAVVSATANGTIGSAEVFPLLFSGNISSNNTTSCIAAVMCANTVSSASTYTVYFNAQYLIS